MQTEIALLIGLIAIGLAAAMFGDSIAEQRRQQIAFEKCVAAQIQLGSITRLAEALCHVQVEE